MKQNDIFRQIAWFSGIARYGSSYFTFAEEEPQSVELRITIGSNVIWKNSVPFKDLQEYCNQNSTDEAVSILCPNFYVSLIGIDIVLYPSIVISVHPRNSDEVIVSLVGELTDTGYKFSVSGNVEGLLKRDIDELLGSLNSGSANLSKFKVKSDDVIYLNKLLLLAANLGGLVKKNQLGKPFVMDVELAGQLQEEALIESRVSPSLGEIESIILSWSESGSYRIMRVFLDDNVKIQVTNNIYRFDYDELRDFFRGYSYFIYESKKGKRSVNVAVLGENNIVLSDIIAARKRLKGYLRSRLHTDRDVSVFFVYGKDELPLSQARTELDATVQLNTSAERIISIIDEIIKSGSGGSEELGKIKVYFDKLISYIDNYPSAVQYLILKVIGDASKRWPDHFSDLALRIKEEQGSITPKLSWKQGDKLITEIKILVREFSRGFIVDYFSMKLQQSGDFCTRLESIMSKGDLVGMILAVEDLVQELLGIYISPKALSALFKEIGRIAGAYCGGSFRKLIKNYIDRIEGLVSTWRPLKEQPDELIPGKQISPRAEEEWLSATEVTFSEGDLPF